MKHIGTIWEDSEKYIKIESFEKDHNQMVRLTIGKVNQDLLVQHIDLRIDQADHFSDLSQDALPIPNY